LIVNSNLMLSWNLCLARQGTKVEFEQIEQTKLSLKLSMHKKERKILETCEEV
jgi:hypothetical protein